MLQPALVAILTAATFALLAWSGRLRSMAEEFPNRPRAAAGLVLLAGLLALIVYYPTVYPGAAADVDPQTMWFPSIFAGHVVILIFLQAWWMLAWPIPVPRYLRLEGATLADVGFGVRVGIIGWVAALAASALVTGLLMLVGWQPDAAGGAADPLGIPPLILWLAERPIEQKLLIIAAAMTVEEGLYRAFLQPRIGWIASSVLFALSHAGYGLPTLLASVFAVSLVIGWAFRRSGNLLPCVVAHGVFDAIQLLVIMPAAIEQMRRLG